MSTKGKILMAMSGGLDSSVSALLLQEQGYEVVGVTMKLWDYALSCKSTSGACCDVDAINDARELAVKLNIPHFVIDFRDEFKRLVINNFIDEYLRGRTPNPCIMCNIHLKWTALIQKAQQLGCDAIATGHYAIVKHENQRYFVSKGKDNNKDQSYVLWGLSQENLAKTIFPLGAYTKSQVREIAKDLGFERLANKRESYDICFIPDNNYRIFLEGQVENLHQKIPQGNILDTSGNIVGQHKGYPFYTIGQRKGLELAFGTPKYVCKINAQTNEITLGDKSDLLSNCLEVTNFVLSKYEKIPSNFHGQTKIRYRDQGQESVVEQLGDKLKVEFSAPVYSITPGQSAVIYQGDDVVAGGLIKLC